MEFGEIIVILDVKDKTNDNKQPVSDHTLSSNVILVRSSPLSTEFRENRFKHGNASITSTQCVYVCVCVCVCGGGMLRVRACVLFMGRYVSCAGHDKLLGAYMYLGKRVICCNKFSPFDASLEILLTAAGLIINLFKLLLNSKRRSPGCSY